MLSPVDLLESVLRRIDELEARLEAWVTVDREGARAEAEARAREAERGVLRGPLHGIPIGVKDIYLTAGMRTTAGSRILGDHVPTYDAAAVARLKEAGAVILGKTETTEFAHLDPAPTRNPWNLEHTPGGSSSGSAAAVAAGMCPAALGSQTGGSTLRPAAFCGIAGLKPTFGRVSRYGVIPLSWSLDHVGVLTRGVESAALLLEVLAGHDPKDPYTADLPVLRYRRALEALSPPRLGLLGGPFHDLAHEEVRRNLEGAVRRLEGAGAEVEEARLPESFGVVLSAHRVLMVAEAAAVHGDLFRERMSDFRPRIRGAIAAGLLMPSSTYLKAQRIRAQTIREMADLLTGFDCLLTPAATTPAPRGLGSTGDPAFNSPWSLCGFPSMALPSGVTREGLPLGIQLVAPPFCEEGLLRAARWCERALGFGAEPHDPR